MAHELPSAPTTSQTLSELIDGQTLSLERALRLTGEIARQVRSQHEQGRLHGRLALPSIRVLADQQVELASSTRPLTLGGQHSDLEFCPPEFAGGAELVLPLEIRAARGELQNRNLDVDPRRIDVYQIAAVLCRLATGLPVRQYADSPRAKASVPAIIRKVLDNALGFDSEERVKTCNAFLDSIDDALASLSRLRSLGDKSTPADGSFTTSDTSVFPTNVTPLGDAQPTPAGEQLAHYRLLELIGRGGMGEVYRAHDQQLDRMVAVKVLRKELQADATFLRRFRNEADIIARLPHPNLVPLYYVGEDHGRCFYAMRLIEGESLAQRLRLNPTLTVDETMSIVTQCLSALAVAHDEGLIHRDIKPANILLERGTGRAYVVDFGLARRLDDNTGLTTQGVVMGTVEYLAPEQARGAKGADQRADLYSLGVVLYQMLSGQMPFVADSAVGWIFQHAHEPPRPLEELAPHVPAQLAGIVNRLLAKSPAERPDDCRAVLQLLEPWQPAQLRTRQISSELSSVLTAPPMPEFDLPPPPSPVQRLLDGAATILRRHTPQCLDKLQSTEQHAAGAVALYERRLRRLARLQGEGHQVLALLQQQVTDHRQASAAATSDHERETNEEQLAALLSQVEPLAEQVAQLDLEVARVQATLAGLTSSRDHLLARLKQVRPAVDDKVVRRSSRYFGMAMAASVLFLIITTAVGITWWRQPGSAAVVPPQREIVPPPPPPPPPPPTSAEYLAKAQHHVVRQQWPEARVAYEKYLSQAPDDIYRRCELASICLFLNDRAAYDQHCRQLVKTPQVFSDEYVPTFAFGTLCLAPWPPGGYKVDPFTVLQQIVAKSPDNSEAQGFVTVAMYRAGKWSECIQSVERKHGGVPLSFTHAVPRIYGAMASARTGNKQAAKTRLAEIKVAVEKIRPQAYVGWWAAKGPEVCALEGLRARIAYREAALLILGRADDLKLSPIVNSDGSIYRDPPPPPIDPKTYLAQAHDHIVRQQWAEARTALIKYLAVRPTDVTQKCDLATICLMFGSSPEYEQYCRELVPALASSQGYTTTTLARTFSLAPTPGEALASDLSARLQEVIAKDEKNYQAQRYLVLTRYREGKWAEADQSGKRWYGDRLAGLDDALPEIFGSMAQWQLGDKEAAKERLLELKAAAERMRPVDYTLDWFATVPAADRQRWFAMDGLRARIAYREAAQLILGRVDDLQLSPVVNADGTMYVDPPLASTDPQDAKVAEIVRKLGGKLTVDVNGAPQPVEPMQSLPPVYRLVGIDLIQCKGVTPEHTAEIGKLKSLETAKFLYGLLSEEAFANLAHLTTLQQLDCGNSLVTGESLAKFERMPKLRAIVFGGPFRPENGVYFDRFPNLRGLYLSWTSMDDDGLQRLPALAKVDHLTLTRTKVTGSGLSALKRFPKLTRLSLGVCPITDAGLENLPIELGLTELELEETQITDAAIPHLSKFTKLRVLKLNKTSLTANGIAQLQLALPNCKIEFPAAEAISTLDSLSEKIKQNPQDAGSLLARAALYQRRNAWTEAASDCAGYLKVHSDDLWVLMDAALMELAAGHEEQYAAYCVAIEKALPEATMEKPYRTRAARILSLRPKAFQAGEKLHAEAKAMADQKQEPWALAPLAAISYRLGRYDEALPLCERIEREFPDQLGFVAAATLWRAMALQKLDRKPEAQAALAKGRELVTARFPPAGDAAYGYDEYAESFLLLREAEDLLK